MPIPATKGQLKTNLNEMRIGDYIVCSYKALTSGQVGTFYDLGGEIREEIPVEGSANPNGSFYFVKVDRGLLIADRVVQHSISWNALNARGLIQGYEWKGGLSFNGVNSYVNIPYASILAPTSAITCRVDISMEDWTDTANMVILSKLHSGGYGFNLNNQVNERFVFSVRIGSNYRQAIFDVRGFEPNSRHSFVGTFDGRYIKLYVDGELKNVIDLGSNNLISYQYNNSLFFGCDVGSGSSPDPNPYYFKGNIYLSAIWNRALTEQEVIGQNSTGVINYRSGLVGYWDFKQVFNNILYDLVGSNNGIINNCVYIESDEKIVVRSLTGGVAYADANGNSSTTDQGYGGWPTNNEWDKYIVNFPQELIQDGKTLNDIFHIEEGIASFCQDTLISGFVFNGTTYTDSSYRCGRGAYYAKYMTISPADRVINNWGFRPVLEYKEV